MVAFPRINAPKPAPSRRFSTFSTSSVGSFPRKNRSPTLAPCDPGFHPAIEQSRSLPLCGARKKSSRCSLARFFDRRISSNPCRSASAFGGTNRSPAPHPPRSLTIHNPHIKCAAGTLRAYLRRRTDDAFASFVSSRSLSVRGSWGTAPSAFCLLLRIQK